MLAGTCVRSSSAGVFAFTAAISPFLVLLALSSVRASMENCSYWLFLELEGVLGESCVVGNAQRPGRDLYASPYEPRDHTSLNLSHRRNWVKRLEG